MPTVEAIARRHYGRLLAWLAAGFRDLAAAEDALQDAFAAALWRWPTEGVPEHPDAWLLATAKRRIFDRLRQRKVSDAFAVDLRHTLTEAEDAVTWQFPDNRLKLMFVCAHPDIEASMHAPLMLQTVLGLDSRSIADAFVVSPSAMSQRLVRVKAKIAAATLAFEIPEREALPQRLDSVLQAIYAAYTSAWTTTPDSDTRGLAGEAAYLAQLCVDLSPGEPEALGLLALIRFSDARAVARFAADGAYVPMDEQDVTLWDRGLIAQAEATLDLASRNLTLGRYQLEAAIQSAHISARQRGVARSAVLPLYRALVSLHPSFGAWTGYAAALAQAGETRAAKQVLDDLGEDRMRLYQPWWAVMAEVATRLGDTASALRAYDMAEGLEDAATVKAWLRQRRNRLLQ
ncbi:RNA polymerase sigma factor [Asticcacaulis sp. AC402]|uniref:RNA polymerase sigma factor n=1 Tax=Asticcacaulis sp. AC402 TaxID=1282361 RepID=UPI0003C3E675|nr:DUF6596 domain-containing protein [Asticcacaulis sp. AC402]ESQ75635.1 hypothetical protein ABAC402_08910 [Asticcacaulis sp. AC402]